MIILGYNISRLDIYKCIKPLYNFENLKTLKNIFNNTYTEELVDFPDISLKKMTFLLWSYCAMVYKYYELGKSIPDDCLTIAIRAQKYSEELKHLDAAEEEKRAMFINRLLNIIISNKATELLYVIVKFPEITIQQSVENITHTIYDLYVKIPITFAGKLAIPEFFVQRGLITADEYIHNYSHSHAPASDIRAAKWLKFCTGSGPLHSLNEKMFLTFNSKMWVVYLAEINRALTIESERGGPYIRMRQLSNFHSHSMSISMANYNQPVDYDISIYRRPWIKEEIYFINNYVMPNIDKFIYRVNTEFYIKNNLTELCMEFTKLYNEFNKKTGCRLYEMWYLKNTVGHTFYYYNVNEINLPKADDLGYIFHFKGQPIHRKISQLADLEQLKLNIVKVADPQGMMNLLICLTRYLQSYEYNKIKSETIKNNIKRADTDYLRNKARINPRERFMWDS